MALITRFTEKEDGRVFTDVPLFLKTTYRIGGKAKFYAEPKSPEAFSEIYEAVKADGIPVFVLGKGSKLLVSDKGFDGLVLSTAGLKGIAYRDGLLTAAAGETVGSLTAFTVKNGLSGLEFLSGIPASVGGLVKMNAGAFTKSVADVLSSFAVLSGGKTRVMNVNPNAWGYRKSPVFSDETVLSATFRVEPRGVEYVKGGVREVLEKRKRFPRGASCGSVFRNPKGGYAAAFIEACGLKGAREGGAEISPLHANFIVNTGGATATDVYRLINRAKEKVKDTFSVSLTEEVLYLGEFL